MQALQLPSCRRIILVWSLNKCIFVMNVKSIGLQSSGFEVGLDILPICRHCNCFPAKGCLSAGTAAVFLQKDNFGLALK